MLKFGFCIKFVITIGFSLVQIISNCFSNLLLSMIFVPLLQTFLPTPKLSFTISISHVEYKVADDYDGKISHIV